MNHRVPSFRCRLRKAASNAWPEFALVMALGLTGTATWSTYNLMTVQRRGQVRGMTANLGNTIHHRLRIFEHALHNARSFVLSRGIETFTRPEFNRFVSGLDLDAQVLGLKALEFVSLDQCYDERDPRRRNAMRTSRDSGHETLTDHLDDAVFEMYLPVFEPGRRLTDALTRRAAMRGWIRVRFEARSFLTEVTADLRRVAGDVGIEVFDGPEKRAEARFFVSEATDREYIKPVSFLRKYLANHAWTVRVRPTPATFAANWPPWWALIAALGLAASLWIYLSVRRYARVARRLQRSESMLRLVMNGVPALISYIGLDQRYVYANLGYERITGVPREKIVGQSVRDVLGPEFWSRFGDHLKRALAGEDVAFEHDLFRINGQTRHMSGHYIPHRNRRGEVAGVVALVHDVTEARAAQEQLRAVATENAALYAEAQAVNRVKDEFLATLSHELRTPLNVILGYSELLLEEPLDEVARGFVRTVQRNAHAQNQLIADLLDISAIINGKLSFTPALINLSEIVRDAVDGISFAAESKGVRLHCTTGHRPCTINGDPTRVRQIVWNLLSNAVKFTPAGGDVRIRVAQTEDQFEIEVTDSGIGIDADFLPYVFDRFRQEDASRARRFGGLGLGLSIVRHLVEMHGGHIRVSSPGKDAGSTFTVCLPKSERTLRLSEGALA